MQNFESILLGLVQGLTEFLPISSSAHLQIVPFLLGLKSHKLGYDVIMHLGTLFAVLIYFKNDLKKIIFAFFEKSNSENVKYKKLLWMLFIGTLPAAVAGLILKDFFENMFANILFIAIFLGFTGLILFFSEYLFAKKKELKDINNLTLKDSLLVGIAQALAILPGISRSGSTVAAGLMLGVNKEDAARFSFLLAIPAILGAVVLESKNILAALHTDLISCGLAFLTSLFFGYLAIAFFISFLKKHSLKIFSVYCFIVSLITLLKYSFLR